MTIIKQDWNNNQGIGYAEMADMNPASAQDIESELATKIPSRGIIINMSNKNYITSEDFKHLLNIRKIAEENEKKLILSNIQTGVFSAFLITGSDKLFNIVEDDAAALESINRSKPIAEKTGHVAIAVARKQNSREPAGHRGG